MELENIETEKSKKLHENLSKNINSSRKLKNKMVGSS